MSESMWNWNQKLNFPWISLAGCIASIILLPTLQWYALIITILLLLATLGAYHGMSHFRISQMAWLQDNAIDWELKEMLKEKGLSPLDSFDQIIRQSKVIEYLGEDLSEACHLAAEQFFPDSHNQTLDLTESFLTSIQQSFIPPERGFIIPHHRSPKQINLQLVLLRSQRGIAIPASSDHRTYAFFFLLSPTTNPSIHLQTLARLAKRMERAYFLEEWKWSPLNFLPDLILQHERSITFHVNSSNDPLHWVNKHIRTILLPNHCLITWIRRGEELIIPKGNTLIKPDDRITIVGDPENIRTLYNQYYHQFHEQHPTSDSLD